MGHFRRTRSVPPTRRIRQLLLALSLGVSVVVLLWQMILTGSADEGSRRREGGLVQIDSRVYFVDPDDEEGDNIGSEAQGESGPRKRSKAASGADADADADEDSERQRKALEKQRVDAVLAEQGTPLNAQPRHRRKKHEHRRRAATTARPGVRVRHSALPQRSPHENVCGLYEHLDLPASNESGPQYTYRYRHVRIIRAPNEQHLCDKDTQVFAAINSGVFNFERRNAVRFTSTPRAPVRSKSPVWQSFERVSPVATVDECSLVQYMKFC